MISKILYLTSPDPGRYILNAQLFGSDELIKIEVPADQLRNVLVDGVTLMLRNSFHRVPVPETKQISGG